MQEINKQSDQNNSKAVVDDELLLEHNQSSSEPQTEEEVTQKDTIFMNVSSRLFIILTVVAVLAGVGTGFGTFRLTAKSQSSQTAEVTNPSDVNSITAGDVFGSESDVFDTNAEGYIEAGGLDGEGSHKLLRPGGDSQTVYLTSSVTDLDSFIGMEVKIWGETFKGQKAGWFMDVGKVEVEKVDGESPAVE